MAGVVTERYHPVVLAANATAVIPEQSIGGFLCVTAGTITITSTRVAGPFTIVNAMPVAAGVYYPIPYYLGSNGGSVTLAGGASGVLGV